MAALRSDYSFVYLAQKQLSKIGILPDNVSVHYIDSIFSNWFGNKFLHSYRIKKALKILKGDMVVAADNLIFKDNGIPVCLLLMHSTELLQDTVTGKKFVPARKMFTNAIRKAATVITFSDNDYQRIKLQLPEQGAKIKLLFPLPADMPELKWTDKEIVKVESAGGAEYFLFAGDLHERFNLVALLKAFSIFKKWQQSNMQLLIAGSKTSTTENFGNQLASYKYRKEVNLIINPSKETLQKLIAGAYALVYPALYDGFPVNILSAMQAGVPVISSSAKVCKEWCGDTIIYPETDDSAGFAKSMQLIYKDERLRSDFIVAAKKHLVDKGKDDVAKKCLNFFEETIAK